MEGKHNYKPKEGFEDKWHVIGEGDKPVYICRKGEVPELFNTQFWYIFELWKFYHYGFGLPDGKHYEELDPDLVNSIYALECHYETHFARDRVMIQYQEATIKLLRNIAELLSKGR